MDGTADPVRGNADDDNRITGSARHALHMAMAFPYQITDVTPTIPIASKASPCQEGNEGIGIEDDKDNSK